MHNLSINEKSRIILRKLDFKSRTSLKKILGELIINPWDCKNLKSDLDRRGFKIKVSDRLIIYLKISKSIIRIGKVEYL